MSIYRGTGGSSTTTDETTINAVNQKAAEAATSATNAASSASSASTSASNSATSASQAATSATNAATSASQALQSKNTAGTSATAAQAAQVAAEAAQVEAESAKDTAVTYGSNAVSANTTAQAAKTAAETARDVAKGYRDEILTAEVDAEASAAAAASSEVNAAASEASASLSESNASSSASAAAASAIAADASAFDAATSEANAAASETASAASAVSASTSAASATNSATAASTSATAAATSASNASTSETNAAASETASATSATNAADSETAAASSATAAATSETNASSSATAAANSATAAASSATAAAASEASVAADAATATTKAAEAATSETNAAASATTATTKASEAATSATNAATSETNASASESAAATSATAASAAKDAALAALDSFDDRYLGVKSSDPTLDNDGNALVSGALYFDSVTGVMKVYDGTQWLAAYADLSGALIATANLSDLTNVVTARSSLGLGTAATTASTDYATAAQGALADSALQSFTETDPVFTAWDKSTGISITESQISDFGSYETAFSKNTAFNKNFGTTSGTVAQGNDSRINNGQTAYGWGDHGAEGYLTGNQTITLTGDVSGSGTTSIAVTIADDSHNHTIANVDGLQTALDGKVDDSQVLTNVPAGAVFTDTTYSVGNGGLTEVNFTSALNTKLSGIESGATADQTAAEILTAIKTVDGAGSGLDADTLDGYHLSTTYNSANTVPVRDANGYLNLGWINTTSGNTTSTLTDIYVNTNDGYIRKATPAHFRSQITDGVYASASHTHSYLPLSGGTLTGALAANAGISQDGFTILNGSDTWLRTNGQTGWYSDTYGGGWYMTDSTYVRTYSNKSIYTAGEVLAGGNVTAYSDIRLKTNIEVIPNALEKVQTLSGYTYDRVDTELRQTGVIAQEVQKVLPEAVTEDLEGTLGVNYGSMVGLLIEAIKEQQAQIDELKIKLEGK